MDRRTAGFRRAAQGDRASKANQRGTSSDGTQENARLNKSDATFDINTVFLTLFIHYTLLP